MDVPPPAVLNLPLVVPEKTLMGPGPSNCSPRVLQALSLPVLGHLHPECTKSDFYEYPKDASTCSMAHSIQRAELVVSGMVLENIISPENAYLKIMDDIKEGIRYVFQTNNELTLALSTSGHGGMEAVMCNLLEPGDKILIPINGIWGERACIMASRYGGEVSRIEKATGTNFSLQELEDAIKKNRPSVLFVVQGESSTGVYQPIDGLGLICHKYDCLLAVDTVASLGGVPFYADRWEVDAVYTGSQKVLGAPPGLAPISFSRKAQNRIFARKIPVKVFYWDMTILGDYWACFGRPRVYHHTVSSTLLCGLREGLAIIAKEGLENTVNRHKQCAQKLHDGLHKMGLELFVEALSARLPTVTTIKVPQNIDWKTVTGYAMKYYFLEFSGGLGPTINQVFRIGLMGHNATNENVEFVLKVFKEALEFAQNNPSSKL